MKFLLVSAAPWAKGGYPNQALILSRILKGLGHEVDFFAYAGLTGTAIEFEGSVVYPKSSRSMYGWEILPWTFARSGADVGLTIWDGFMLDPVKTVIRDLHATGEMPMAHWLPIDTSLGDGNLPTELGFADHNILTYTQTIPIAMTRHGEAMLKGAGLDPLYAPHAIDTANLWVPPDPEKRAAAREAIRAGDETFVIISDSTNEDVHDRKNWHGQLTAFARFHERHPDSLFYAHTLAYRHPVGLDLTSMTIRLGIHDAMRWPEEELLSTGGVSDQMLYDNLYAAADIYTGASKAEGFGIPLAQAAACGIPTVTTNAGAMAEVGEAGLLADGEPCWSTLHTARWHLPLIRNIDAAYERYWALWQDQRLWRARQVAAREHAMRYDIKTVAAEHWPGVIKGIQERIARPAAEPPVAVEDAGDDV